MERVKGMRPVSYSKGDTQCTCPEESTCPRVWMLSLNLWGLQVAGNAGPGWGDPSQPAAPRCPAGTDLTPADHTIRGVEPVEVLHYEVLAAHHGARIGRDF